MIWNKIVTRRFETYGFEILVGDLYMTDNDDDDNEKVNFVTEINRSEIKLSQLVLPLPGHDIVYPKNSIHSWYKDLLKEDGIDIDQFKCQIKDYSLSGDYRHFIVKPGNVDYHRVHYSKPDDDSLLQSDYDRICGKEFLTTTTSDNGQYLGLIISFSLPKSCYATMALRELLHRNESQLLQNQHQDNCETNEEAFLRV